MSLHIYPLRYDVMILLNPECFLASHARFTILATNSLFAHILTDIIRVC